MSDTLPKKQALKIAQSQPNLQVYSAVWLSAQVYLRAIFLQSLEISLILSRRNS